MTTLTSRAGKGAALTHGELDANLPQSAQTKAANYTVLISDNRDTIEVTATATIDLPDASVILASSDTDDFQITIKNNTGTTTIGRVNASDTIDGVASDVVLTVVDSVTLKVNQAGDGYNIIAGGVSITGKILVSPVINTPQINSATITTAAISNLTVNTSISGDVIDNDPLLASDSATKVPTQQAVKSAIEGIVSGVRVDLNGNILGQSGGFGASRTGAGTYTVTHPMGSVNTYAVVGSPESSTGTHEISLTIFSGSVTVRTFDSSGTLLDGSFNLIFTGF